MCFCRVGFDRSIACAIFGPSEISKRHLQPWIPPTDRRIQALDAEKRAETLPVSAAAAEAGGEGTFSWPRESLRSTPILDKLDVPIWAAELQSQATFYKDTGNAHKPFAGTNEQLRLIQESTAYARIGLGRFLDQSPRRVESAAEAVTSQACSRRRLSASTRNLASP